MIFLTKKKKKKKKYIYSNTENKENKVTSSTFKQKKVCSTDCMDHFNQKCFFDHKQCRIQINLCIPTIHRARKEMSLNMNVSYFSTKTYLVGTH